MLPIPFLILAAVLSIGSEHAIAIPQQPTLDQTAPSIARNDSGGALVVWGEQSNFSSPASYLAMRVDRNGRPRDAAPCSSSRRGAARCGSFGSDEAFDDSN